MPVPVDTTQPIKRELPSKEKTREHCREDEVLGKNNAIASHMGNHSCRAKSAALRDAAAQNLRSWLPRRHTHI